MVIAHNCLQCGSDLSRVRALVEPVYGWPLVRCPRCRTAAVRRRHPLEALRRRARRIARSLILLLIQVVGLGVAFWLSVAAVIIATGASESAVWFLDAQGAQLVVPFAFAAVTGGWLGASLRHLHPLLVLIPFTIVVWGCTATPASIEAIVEAIEDGVAPGWWRSPVRGVADASAVLATLLPVGVATAVLGNQVARRLGPGLGAAARARARRTRRTRRG